MRTIFNTTLLILFLLTTSSTIYSQDINIKIGHQDSIQSKVLKETRHLLIHLPESYGQNNKNYPVLYRLDGDKFLLMETVAITDRLTYADEVSPEMIIVLVANTNRPRDMWPVNTEYYPETKPAGAKNFLAFIEKELIPYIDKKYQTNNDRILCGQSLSAVFTLYAFLAKARLFESYIAISGAFPGCESFFVDLANKTFENPNQFTRKELYISNGLKDPLDPQGSLHQQVVDFSKTVEQKLNKQIRFQYQTYENEGHVPFHSLYDGLKFVFLSSEKTDD